MAGYSGTPLVRKLGIKPSHVVLALNVPADVDPRALLNPMPPGAKLVARNRSKCDIVLLFAQSCREFDTRLPAALKAIDRSGTVWAIWPKKSSERFKSGPGDLTEDVIRALALQKGIVDVKVCAVDETWSGLKLVYRLTNR